MFSRVLRQATALHLITTTTIRGFHSTTCFASTMATPPQSFKLDRSIFNETLYSRLRDFWFEDVPEGTIVPTLDLAKKWFGVQQTDEQKAEFDRSCHSNFNHALEALAPERLALPPFQSYEDDIQKSADLSAPLFREVQDTQARDPRQASQTLLSLILLLDQMTRNIYRDPQGLRLVYNHYDRLAFALLRSSMALTPNPIDHESVRRKPVFQAWYLMPLMHSEHLPSHELYSEIFGRWTKEVEELDIGEGPKEYMERSMGAETKHREPLERFGRYPHRNQALDRTNTKEEEEYLQIGDTFGVKQEKKVADDHEKTFEKDEL